MLTRGGHLRMLLEPGVKVRCLFPLGDTCDKESVHFVLPSFVTLSSPPPPQQLNKKNNVMQKYDVCVWRSRRSSSEKGRSSLARGPHRRGPAGAAGFSLLRLLILPAAFSSTCQRLLLSCVM